MHATPRTYAAIAENLDRFKEMAKLVHLSQMVPGIKDADMAFMVLMECEMTGQTVFEWDQENHIICGRPSMKYDAMVAAFNAMKDCRVKMLAKTPEKASLLLIDGDDATEFTLTWDDAKKEPWVYDGKESDNVAILAKGETPPRMKAKYATPRSRAIMLYARCVSDAIRTTRPEVTKGRYTPEEIEDFDVIDAESVTEVAQPKLSDPKKLEAPKPRDIQPAAEPTPAAKTEPAAPAAPTTVANLEPAKPTAPAAPASPAAPAAPTAHAADESQPASLVGQSTASVDGPTTDVQYKTILSLLESLKKEGVDAINPVKAKLAAYGLKGIMSLTYAESDDLILKLQNKEIETWIAGELGKRLNPK